MQEAYEVTELAVESLLEDVLALRERTQYKGDYNAVDTLLDFDEALKLADLTGRQLKVLKLYYIDGYKQSEIASMLGVGQPNVSTYRKAAIKKLVKIYENWEELSDESSEATPRP